MPSEAGDPDGVADGLAAATGNAAFVLALRERGVRDTAVLRAMERVPRERFAPPALRAHARRDIALPLACGQTMTAPSIVAAMLGALDIAPGARVLEVGTGTGYVTALLVQLGAAHVRSLERYDGLARAARSHLGRDFDAAAVETTDGLAPEVVRGGSYDRILVNGSLAALPPHLPAVLRSGGRLVAGQWTGRGSQLVTLTRDGAAAYARTEGAALRLGPLTPGRALAP
ncbi:protein-L-isoaspartate O-methyltransferase [Methylorubrum thiocyanatum]|uniref:protein-L-isoaspartate O-methyltransferase family protein n=1 Tax=Methylorubrum TaxID=2282523 RepID=UPI003839F576